MKKKYINPELKINSIQLEDILMVSDNNVDGGQLYNPAAGDVGFEDPFF